MQLRCVRAALVAAAAGPLTNCSVAGDLFALPRQRGTRGLHSRRRVSGCMAHARTATLPLQACWEGDRWAKSTPEWQALPVDGVALIKTLRCVRSCGGAVSVVTASSLPNTTACTRSPLAGSSLLCAAVETPRRCCASLTGVARAPFSSSRDLPQLGGSRHTRPPSDSSPSSAAREHVSQKRHQRARAPADCHARPFPERRGTAARLSTSKGYDRHDPPPTSREEAPTKGDVDGASVADHVTDASTAGGAAFPSAAAHDVTTGWGLEDVSCRTGRTRLEELYERNLERIRAIMEQPLPPMPQDGSVSPDLFVGFASYSYQLRDQYRAVLARELQVPVKAVRLSVAWSGRFDVRHFGRVQKVCGVYVDREVLLAAACSERDCDAKMRTAEEDAASLPSPASASPLPETHRKRIHALVAAINKRGRDDLLQASFFQASLPIPEVEFALTRREHRILFCLHEWIRRRVLQRAVAVVVYGVPPPPPTATATGTGPASARPPCSTDLPEKHAITRDTANATDDDQFQQSQYEQWRCLCSTRTAEQKRAVQDKWLRLLHRRKLVPLMMSLTELATLAASAVVRDEVRGIALQHTKASAAVDEGGKGPTARRDTPLMSAVASPAALDASLQDVLVRITAVLSPPPPVTLNDGGAPAEDSEECGVHPVHLQDVIAPCGGADSATADVVAAPRFRPASTAQRESTMRWVRLVYQALILRETQSSADDHLHATAAPPAMRVSHQASLPALFTHGVYAGGHEEVMYLQRNRAAMDALLLHPHEISFKKKFVSRMRNGHRRLRMEEESAAPYSTSM
ncbi:hypothetical protein LSCM1_05103 [Leishmania martiniquensis]|uniref:Uncharacterized protein n=1 Tax=Leishmania martiniquensis TaxID=1580590 RepID=A0A836KTM8_9TRYP|nr:hypothetical protein LSCM1_05103 [Leishmania martiniquensis]